MKLLPAIILGPLVAAGVVSLILPSEMLARYLPVSWSRSLARPIAAIRSALLPAVILAPFVALILAPWWAMVAGLTVLITWMALTRAGRQATSVARVGLATLRQRVAASSVIVVGIAGVVCVLVALLAMAAGFEATLRQTGTDDTAIVLRAGAQTETNSLIDHDSARIIAEAPQVLKDAHGQPIASPELVVVASLPKRSTGTDANVELRGIGERAWDLHRNVRILAGRTFRPGLRELIVGKSAHEQFASLNVGSSLKLGGQLWTIAGIFESGDSHDSELWADEAVAGAT